MQSKALNKPTYRKTKLKRINVALGYKAHRKLKRYARAEKLSHQAAAERAVDLLPL